MAVEAPLGYLRATHHRARQYRRTRLTAPICAAVGPIRFDTADTRYASGEWVRYYAADLMRTLEKRPQHWFRRRLTLKFWLDEGAWWTIRNPKNPDDCWLLLPGLHPAAPSTTTIESTRSLLQRMLNSNCEPDSAQRGPAGWPARWPASGGTIRV